MAEQSHTPGPFCLNETATELQVQGRHGRIVQRYPLTKDGRACAKEDLRRRQLKFAADERRVRDAAPELLEAVTDLLALRREVMEERATNELVRVAKACDAVAKAVGASAKATGGSV